MVLATLATTPPLSPQPLTHSSWALSPLSLLFSHLLICSFPCSRSCFPSFAKAESIAPPPPPFSLHVQSASLPHYRAVHCGHCRIWIFHFFLIFLSLPIDTAGLPFRFPECLQWNIKPPHPSLIIPNVHLLIGQDRQIGTWSQRSATLCAHTFWLYMGFQRGFSTQSVLGKGQFSDSFRSNLCEQHVCAWCLTDESCYHFRF